MSIFKKMTAALLSAGIFCSMGISFTASAANEVYEDVAIDPSKSFLVDDANMLTNDQETELTEKIQATAEHIDMNILVYVSGTAIGGSDSNTLYYCEELCLNYYDKSEDSVVLYLDLAGKGDTSYAPYDYIYTRNRARFYYPGENEDSDDNIIPRIFSDMNPYLPRGAEDPYSALEEFLWDLEYFYDHGPSDLRYFYIADTGKYVTMKKDGSLVHRDSRPINWGKWIMIGAVISLIITIITFFVIKSHYKFKSAPSSLAYLRSDQITMGQRSDVFIRKYQTRTKIESSSGGGGGHSGGGTSSGGGGGGNHR